MPKDSLRGLPYWWQPFAVEDACGLIAVCQQWPWGALTELTAASYPAWFVEEPSSTTGDVSLCLCAWYCSCSSYENISGTISSAVRLTGIPWAILSRCQQTLLLLGLCHPWSTNSPVRGTVGQDFGLQAQETHLGAFSWVLQRRTALFLWGPAPVQTLLPLLCWGGTRLRERGSNRILSEFRSLSSTVISSRGYWLKKSGFLMTKHQSKILK